MEGRGFGFVTFTDPAHAQSFLEVGVKVQQTLAFNLNMHFLLHSCRSRWQEVACLACRVYEFVLLHFCKQIAHQHV